MTSLFGEMISLTRSALSYDGRDFPGGKMKIQVFQYRNFGPSRVGKVDVGQLDVAIENLVGGKDAGLERRRRLRRRGVDQSPETRRGADTPHQLRVKRRET